MEEERIMNEFLKTLKERSRRTVKRLYEKGTIKWDNENKTFIDEEGQALLLQFRNGYGTNKNGSDVQESIDEFGDDIDDDEE